MILHYLDDGCRAGGGEEVAAKIVTLQLPESWNVRRVCGCTLHHYSWISKMFYF